jgi:hypothetical protein
MPSPGCKALSEDSDISGCTGQLSWMISTATIRVEAEYNTSTVAPASRKRRQKGNPVPEGITGLPCS